MKIGAWDLVFLFVGDEVDMASECFREVGQRMPNYLPFEKMLVEILKDVNYPQNRTIRWEITQRIKPEPPRAGDVTQFWFDVPGERKESKGPFFASGGLYFDFNEEEMVSIWIYAFN